MELRFQDEQNGTEFLLLNSILKEEKKDIKEEEKAQKQHKEVVKKATNYVKKNNTRKSKFSEKYKERVESIQNTDAKIRENRAIAEEIERMEKSKKKRKK